MDEAHRNAIERPIRVVWFGTGPALERGIREFLCRLEEHPEIEFLGGFCQSEAPSTRAAVRDLWRRRGLMAAPVVLAQAADATRRFLANPGAEVALRRGFARLRERIHYVPDIHARGVLASVRALSPDLGLIYGSPVLKPSLFEIPERGTLGIHHGRMPVYRGKRTTFWEMYNGERAATVTIQKVDAGLDTGAIVKQGEVLVGRRSYRAVWNELEELGVDLYIRAILEVKEGMAVYQQTVGEKGKLYREPRFGDYLRLYWRQSAGRLRRS